MVWSAATIPGAPTLLVVDASDEREGWEADFCRRLAGSLQRRGLSVAASRLRRTSRAHLDASPPPNCLLLAGHATPAAPESATPTVLGVAPGAGGAVPPCSSRSAPGVTTTRTLATGGRTHSTDLAPFALAPTSPLTPREAGLYFLKFFIELHLHAPEEISGRMVWFSASKAAALLRRRGLAGTVGARC